MARLPAGVVEEVVKEASLTVVILWAHLHKRELATFERIYFSVVFFSFLRFFWGFMVITIYFFCLSFELFVFVFFFFFLLRIFFFFFFSFLQVPPQYTGCDNSVIWSCVIDDCAICKPSIFINLDKELSLMKLQSADGPTNRRT